MLVATSPGVGIAFSVLAHQAVVDESWEAVLVPSLRARFPKMSEQELADARVYAYGGSHLADLGYFPLGNRLFSDLLHYVRTGDFVNALVTEAATPQEYAFALGALAHYEADRIGHPDATNRTTRSRPCDVRQQRSVVSERESSPIHVGNACDSTCRGMVADRRCSAWRCYR